MYIKNTDSFLKAVKTFKCKKTIADYLVANFNPILSIKGGEYYFSDTEQLQLSLKKLPFYLKPFLNIPKCFK